MRMVSCIPQVGQYAWVMQADGMGATASRITAVEAVRAEGEVNIWALHSASAQRASESAV